jgi:glycosyltransferase involved in cell wall biosynthesis
MSAPKKIHLLISDMGIGGAERVLLVLADEFSNSHQVGFVCLRRNGQLLESIRPETAAIFLNEGNASIVTMSIRSLFLLTRMMRSEPASVFLSTGTGTNLLACLARLLVPNGARLVIREACSSMNSTSRIISVLKRLLYPRADGMIGVSDGVAEELKALAGKRQPVASIPNPVDVVRLNALAARPDGMLADFQHTFILTVGRLVPQKNTALLIDAFARIEKSVDEHLVIIGAGPFESQLRSQIAGYGLDAKIHLLGEISNPQPWFKRASAFVLSSNSEGYPNVLLEALVHNLPVISTNCDFGPRQILDNGRYGKLVKVGDVDGIAQAIRLTLEGALTSDVWDSKLCIPVEIASRYLAFMDTCHHD